MPLRKFPSQLLLFAMVLLLSTSAMLTPSRAVRAEPPDDEAHAELRKQRKEEAEPEKKPDSRESKVPSERSRDAQDEAAESASKESTENLSEDKESPDRSAKDGGSDESANKQYKKKDAEPVVTCGQVTIAGKEIAYIATAGKMVMKTDEGEPKAEVFFIAYAKAPPERHEPQDEADEDEADEDDAERDDPQDDDENGGDDESSDSADSAQRAPRRPITFCFNGGPGSSSVWLHLGMLGPMRVKLGSDAETLPPPHELIPNQYSLLDVTDLVFIDPVSTGFSRPAKGEDKRQFHGYDEDIRSVGQFIHDYTTKYGRWDSPKFLIGESYGGLRAAGLSGELQERYHMYLNGIVLVSAVVDFQTLIASGNNDIAYALFLPSYATTAWYHKALSEDLQKLTVEEVAGEAKRFAMGPYLRALAAGDSLDGRRREEVVRRMAQLTGLDQQYIEASNLRAPMYRFGKELLRKQGLVVGRFDSRYANFALDEVGDSTQYDPSASAVFGAFTSALNDYVRTTLKVKEDRVYEILTDRVHPWDYSEFANRFVNASSALREAMVNNPYLKVFAACGYYDLATPATAMEYTRDHLNLPEKLQDNFTTDYYEAGHMMYAHEPSLKKLRKDLLKFYESALAPLSQPLDAEK